MFHAIQRQIDGRLRAPIHVCVSIFNLLFLYGYIYSSQLAVKQLEVLLVKRPGNQDELASHFLMTSELHTQNLHSTGGVGALF